MTQISGETNGLDLYSDARFWCGIPRTDTTTYTLAEFVRNANFALDKINALAVNADGKWKFVDANSATTTLDTSTALVSGTQAYAIPVTWLKIGRVRAKDSNGDFKTLTPVTRRQLSDAELNDTVGGNPTKYVSEGNKIYLYPQPNYASSGGLEVQQQMGSTYFAYNATTTVPGFDSRFHRLVSLFGALDYCETEDLEKRASKIRARLGTAPSEGIVGSGLIGEFVTAIQNRDGDEKITFMAGREDFGQGALSNNFSRRQDGF